MTINLTDPANHPANGLLAVERIIHVREELQRALWHKNGSTIDYVTADAIKALDELLERRKDATEPVADVVAWSSPNEERTCDIRWRRFDVAPGPLYTAPPGPQSSKMSGIMPDYEGVAMTQRECYMAGKEAGLAEARKSPVIPDGYVLVPVEPTKEMIDAGWLHFMGANNPSSKGTYKAMIAAAPLEVKS